MSSPPPFDAPTEAAGDPVPGRSERGPLEPGSIVGRYEIVGILGRGGMGVVYAAHDPKLERKIAIKFILHERDGVEGAAQLRREAVAMAQVTHANVVTVTDVGEYEGDVYVAMELIEGVTLREWVRAESRGADAIERVFRAAGEGLAALHDAGLVHRDFKPENVMIAGERVVVMDLGLATVDRTHSSCAIVDERALVEGTTQVGGVVGTPAYMSPEQFAGRAADGRSDQFSFAVSLYEALVGQRPYRGEHVLELVTALETEEPRPPPRDAKVSPRTRRALLRALSREPSDRFESMNALLSALRPATNRRVIVPLVVVALGTVAVVVAVVGGEPPPACADPERALAATWDDTARQAVSDAFEGFPAEYQRERQSVVLAQLDRHAAQWRDAYATACTEIAAHQPNADGVMSCLQERAAQLRGVSRVLAEADETKVDVAISSVQDLSPIDECTEAEAQVVTPQAQALREREAEALAALSGGVAGPATALLAELDALANASEVDELVRSNLRGRVAMLAADFGTAQEAWESLYFRLKASGRDRDALRTALELLRLYTSTLYDTEHARHWRREVESMEAVVGTDPRRRADYAVAVGASLIVEGDFVRATTVLQQALMDADRELSDDMLAKAEVANHLGWVLNARQDWQQALMAYRRAAELFGLSMGMRHPLRAGALTNVGFVLSRMGRTSEADAAFDKASTIIADAFGDESHRMGRLLHQRGRARMFEESWSAAKQDLEGAILRLGPDHPDTSYARELLEQTNAALAEGTSVRSPKRPVE